MSPEMLLKHFDQIAEAPDAVTRLRRFILDLAVRGKLVEQNPDDNPASELLKRIGTEKERLIEAGEIPKQKPLPIIMEAELEFDLPQGWTWTRLRNVASYIQRGKSPKYASGIGPLVISQKCIQWDGLHLEWAKAITPESLETYEPIRILRDGDLLWNSTGTGTIGRIIRFEKIDDRIVCDGHVTVVRCLFVDERFVCIWLRSDNVYGTIEERAKGATNQVELTAELANNQIIPIPPLAEQHRIVTKVNELMALCDELKKVHQKRERRRDRMVAATLNGLNNGEAAETGGRLTFKESAQFYFNHLPRLTTRAEHIQQLRQTILNLAVRGKLVPQDPKDEPASELFKQIQERRGRALKGGKFRTQHQLPSLMREEIPFEIPKRWQWVRLVDIGLTQTGTTPSSNNPEYFGDYIPFLKPADLTGNMINYFGDGISKEGIEHSRLIPKHSALMVCIGSSIGKVNITDRDVCCNQQINCITPYLEQLTTFISCALKASYFQKLILVNAGMGTLPIISKGKWEKLPIPLPPLQEQHRIVEAVDEMISICDELESRLSSRNNTRWKLLETTLSQAIE
jgi:type I restriction enzyme S subunit